LPGIPAAAAEMTLPGARYPFRSPNPEDGAVSPAFANGARLR